MKTDEKLVQSEIKGQNKNMKEKHGKQQSEEEGMCSQVRVCNSEMNHMQGTMTAQTEFLLSMQLL